MIEKQAYTYKKFAKNGWQIFLLFVLLTFSTQTALQEPLLAASQSISLADSAAWSTLTFTDVSITPEPIVGQIATLNIEVTSTVDEAEASLAIQLPPDVDLVKGDLVWNGSLRANQPQVHQVAIVVQKKGLWGIYIRAGASSTATVSEHLHINSTNESARVIPDSEFTFIQSKTRHPGNIIEWQPFELPAIEEASPRMQDVDQLEANQLLLIAADGSARQQIANDLII